MDSRMAMDAMNNWLGFSLSQRQGGGSVESSLSSAGMKRNDGGDEGDTSIDTYHHHHEDGVAEAAAAQQGSFTAQMLEIATMSPHDQDGEGKEDHYYHDMVDQSLQVTAESGSKDWHSDRGAKQEYEGYDVDYCADGVEMDTKMRTQKLSHGPVLEDFLGISSSYGGDDGNLAHSFEQANAFLSSASVSAARAPPSSVSPLSYHHGLAPSSCCSFSIPSDQFQESIHEQEKQKAFDRRLHLAVKFPLEDNSYAFHDGLFAAADYPLNLQRHATAGTAFSGNDETVISCRARVAGYKDSSQSFCPSEVVMAPDDGCSSFLDVPDHARFLQMAQSNSRGADRMVSTRNCSFASPWMDSLTVASDDGDMRNCKSNTEASIHSFRNPSRMLPRATHNSMMMMMLVTEDCNSSHEDVAVEAYSLHACDGMESSDNATTASTKAYPVPPFTQAAMAWDGHKVERIGFSNLYLKMPSSANGSTMNCGADHAYDMAVPVSERSLSVPQAGETRSPADNVMQHWLIESSSASPPSQEVGEFARMKSAVSSHAQAQKKIGSTDDDAVAAFDQGMASADASAVAVKADHSHMSQKGGITGNSKKRASTKSPSTERQAASGHGKGNDTFGQRTSQYRGVTRHRWTGRYEAHLWDNSCRIEGQTRKGRQVYLGGYDREDKAARAYDLAALKFWGPSSHINFPLSTYEQELEDMKNMTRQEFVASLRRKSTGFSRGASVYRGVTRHHQQGRWQARIGRVAGSKDLYLGTYSTQEEAAEAYDIAAIKFRGPNAVTNFDISRYDVQMICSSSGFLPRELSGRKKSCNNPPTLVEEEAGRRSHKMEDETVEATPEADGRQHYVKRMAMDGSKIGFSRVMDMASTDLIASAFSSPRETCDLQHRSPDSFCNNANLIGNKINLSLVKLENSGHISSTLQSPATREGLPHILDDHHPSKKTRISLFYDQNACLSENNSEEEGEQSNDTNDFSEEGLSRITGEAMAHDVNHVQTHAWNGTSYNASMLQPPLPPAHGRNDHTPVMRREEQPRYADCSNRSDKIDAGSQVDRASPEEEAAAEDEAQKTARENQGPSHLNNSIDRPSRNEAFPDETGSSQLATAADYKLVSTDGSLHGEEDDTVTTDPGSPHLEVVLEGEFSEVGMDTEEKSNSADSEGEDTSSKKKSYEWWAFAATVGSVQ